MNQDATKNKCTDEETKSLVCAFDYAVKKIAKTLARKAWFELKYFYTAKDKGIDRFSLLLEKHEVNGSTQWHGIFEYGSKNLKVFGQIEES